MKGVEWPEGTLRCALGATTALEVLRLGGAPLSESALGVLGSLTTLRRLDIQNATLGRYGPVRAARLHPQQNHTMNMQRDARSAALASLCMLLFSGLTVQHVDLPLGDASHLLDMRPADIHDHGHWLCALACNAAKLAALRRSGLGHAGPTDVLWPSDC